MLDMIYRYCHGFVVVPVILACKEHGFFTLLQQYDRLRGEHIAQRLGANEGHFGVALRLLRSLNWLCQHADGTYSLTTQAHYSQQIPADLLHLYQFDMAAYLAGQEGLLHRWMARSKAQWGLAHPLWSDFLDGVLLLPLLLALHQRAETRQPPVFGTLAPPVRDELSDFLRSKAWVHQRDGQLCLTALGQFMLERALLTGTTASYKPMLLQMPALLFGDPSQVFKRDEAGHERHLDRTLNVVASGFQHGKYFADVDEIILAIFNRPALAEQPRYVADMGCGDGSLLRRVYTVIRDQSARGKVLDQYPVTMIGIDFNEKSLMATAQTLADIPHCVLQGDISDPARLRTDLQERGIDVQEVLHIRSFLDHDRPFIPPQDLDTVAARRPVPYEGVYVAADGSAIPPAVMVQSLVEHLRRWADLVAKHGMILLEVHCLAPDVIARFVDKSENLHFDAYQAFSMQYLVEADVFLMAAAEAGLFPQPGFSERYPKTFPFCRISLHWFEKRNYTIRHPRLADMDALLRLEAACWEEGLRASAAEIQRRIEHEPQGHCVLELEGRLVGVIYAQRISEVSRLEQITHTETPALHDPQGTIMQLLAVNMLPEVQHYGLGDQLLEFMLEFCACKNGIERVVGITHSRSYRRDLGLSEAAYIQQRNTRGQLVDPILRLHENHGATITHLMPNYHSPAADPVGLWIGLDYDVRQRHVARPPTLAPVDTAPQASAGHDAAALAALIQESVQAVLGRQRLAAFDTTRSLMDMGLDSLQLLELRELLSQALGVELPPTFFFQYGTPEAIAGYFTGQAGLKASQGRHLRPNAARGRAMTAEVRPVHLPQTPREEPIAIIGLACRFPGGVESPEDFWTFLHQGGDAVQEMPRARWKMTGDAASPPLMGGFLHHVDQFDAAFFRMAPKEARDLDPQQRLLLEVNWEALERAGIDSQGLAGSQTGVFVGLFSHDYELLQVRHQAGRSPYFATGNAASVAAGRLAYFLRVQGPALAVDAACASSLVALHLAIRSLQHGECDLALAAGVNVVLAPDLSRTFAAAGLLSLRGRCQTFGADADGLVRSEGCGAVVLKRLSQALADRDNIVAVVRGSAVNHNGASNGLTAPHELAQEAVIRQALAVAGVAPHEVAYVETQGTGTPLGDSVEVEALGAVYSVDRTPDHPLIIGSAKTNIGHTEAASGMAGLCKIILAMQHRTIPRHLHCTAVSPLLDLKRIPAMIPTEELAWPGAAEQPLLAGLSAFGFNGANAHIIIASPPEQGDAEASSERSHHLLTLSAKNDQALQELARRYADFLARHVDTPLEDICFTANTGRATLEHRLGVVAASHEPMREQLQAFAAGQRPPGMALSRSSAERPKIAFLFTGQGAQYVNMGRELYATHGVFREALDRCAEMVQPDLGVSLLDILYPDLTVDQDAAARTLAPSIDQTAYTQPALFALEYALAHLWQAWGITPALVMGHSVGEYVAACVAGVFSLEDGLKLIAARGRLMQALPQQGAMVAVFAAQEQVAEAVRPYPEVSLAAINGPRHSVIAGTSAAVGQAVAALQAQQIKVTRLNVSHAFHSPLMEPMLAEFARVLDEVTLRPPQLDLVANVTGTLATDYIATPAYWLSHVRQPVRFATSVQTLCAYGGEIFLECGPHPILLGMGQTCLPQAAGVWLPSLRRGLPDWQVMLRSVAELSVRGCPIHWASLEQEGSRRKVVLPTYPFQRQRYWFDMPGSAEAPPPEAQSTSQWLPQPVRYGLPPDYMPTPAAVCARLAPELDALLADAHGWQADASLLEPLEALACDFIVMALDRLGWRFQVGQRFATQDMADQLGVLAQHRRVLGRYLQILAEEGVLRQLPADRADDIALPPWASWEVLRSPQIPQIETCLSTLFGLFHRYPRAVSELTLLLRCAPHLAEVLQGRAQPLQLIFPNGDVTTATHLFRHSSAFGMMTHLLQRAIVELVAPLPPGRGVRILEIGAGTGGTTVGVLPSLYAQQTAYVFTDASRLFTQKAAAEFGAYPFVTYEVLDIEKDSQAQGYTLHAYDLIVASNVLHATPALQHTLAHVERLLSADGTLVLLEGSGTRRWTEVIFGLLEGWWKFTDFAWRPTCAFATGAQWQDLLRQAGFAHVAVLAPAPETFQGLFPQSIILATRRAAAPPSSTPPWLILADDQGLGERLAALLQARGEDCAVVFAGSAYAHVSAHTFRINPQRLEDIQQLCRAPVMQRRRQIVYLWPLNAAPAAVLDAAAPPQPHSDWSWPGLQALLREQQAEALWMVTRGTQNTQGRVTDWAARHAMAQAYPQMACVHVDLDPCGRGDDAWTLCDEIHLHRATEAPSEAGNASPHPVPSTPMLVAFRDGIRYVAQPMLADEAAQTSADMLAQLRQAPIGNRRALLETHVRTQVAQVLGLPAADLCDMRQGFFELGMDSFSALQLAARLHASLGCPSFATLTFDYPTLPALVDYLASFVLTDEGGDAPNAPTAPQGITPGHHGDQTLSGEGTHATAPTKDEDGAASEAMARQLAAQLGVSWETVAGGAG